MTLFFAFSIGVVVGAIIMTASTLIIIYRAFRPTRRGRNGYDG